MRRNIDTTCTWLTVSILAGLSCLLSGCRQDNRSAQTPATGEASPRVVAQGQILPAAGIVRLSAAPGDIVQLVEVTEAGTHVEAGTELVVMRSSILREKEISALQAQLTAARQEKTHAIDHAGRGRQGCRGRVYQHEQNLFHGWMANGICGRQQAID